MFIKTSNYLLALPVRYKSSEERFGRLGISSNALCMLQIEERLWRLTVSCKENIFGLIIIYSTSCCNSCSFHVHVYTWQSYTKIGHFHFQGELVFLQDLEPGTRSPCAILEPSSSSVHPLILYWHLLRILPRQQKSPKRDMADSNFLQRGFQPMKNLPPLGDATQLS